MNHSDEKKSLSTVSKRLLLLGLFLLAAGQAVQVNRENPAIDQAKKLEATIPVPPEIRQILRRSCNDCHSNETIWPWYSRVAPVSWLVAYDVREGRSDLNFSEWGAYTSKEKGDKLEEICGRVRRDEMPDGKYTLIHRDARLTAEERNAICAWSEQVREGLGDQSPVSSLPTSSFSGSR